MDTFPIQNTSVCGFTLAGKRIFLDSILALWVNIYAKNDKFEKKFKYFFKFSLAKYIYLKCVIESVFIPVLLIFDTCN